jgi:twinkle protein
MKNAITPIELATKHFGEFKIRGNEITPYICPFCHGGQNKDKNTFAMNMDTGIYNCKRGSCGVSGTFNQLCKELGEDSGKSFEIKRRKVSFTPPATKPETATEKVTTYLKRRGFSPATWERRGVGELNGAIAMPYYEGGKLVLMKFRPAHKPGPKDKKGWREKGGKAVFWGMDLCSTDKPLVIVEGEMDALALDEAGIPNVVSVPNGAEDLTAVDNCWEWLQKFKRVILWVDNDEPGQKLQRNLIQRLGAWRCNVVQCERKDANEVLLFDGKEQVCEIVRNAVEVPINGMTRLADVKAFDYSSTVRVKSSIRAVNEIMGGYMMGQWTIWTGINSSGKSTLLGQEMLEAVDQKFPVCAYSGELPSPVFRYWIDLQAAGPSHLEMKFDSIKNSDIAYPRKDAVGKIREWYRDLFYLYDSYGTVTEDALFEVFEYAVQRYGCKVFMIDNLMTTVFTGAEKDFYRKQSEFVNKVAKFAQQFDVHVHLVAHPRKTTGRLTKMDVAGTGDITNRADNVISVHRVTQDEKDNYGCDNILEIFKNRFSGQQDVEIRLNFDANCKRFNMKTDTHIKRYGWELTNQSISLREVEALFNES